MAKIEFELDARTNVDGEHADSDAASKLRIQKLRSIAIDARLFENRTSNRRKIGLVFFEFETDYTQARRWFSI